MNREEFIEYTRENFYVGVEFLRLLDNVLRYAELQGLEEDDAYNYLCFMLEGIIGYTENEIKQINL